MNDDLRRSAAHVFVDDLVRPRLADADVHHLSRVLRLRAGESVSCSDGRGSWRMCAWSGEAVEPIGEIAQVPARTEHLAVALSPVKGDGTDDAVTKLVEIGIDDIVVLAPTLRSVVRWDDRRVVAQSEKLRHTALAAASQSRRVWLPEVRVGVALADLTDVAVADPDGAPLEAVHRGIAVGPEGGFDPVEIGDRPRVSLGATILRAETAAVVAGTLLIAHRGG